MTRKKSLNNAMRASGGKVDHDENPLPVRVNKVVAAAFEIV
jgi:hypothetical protein